MSKVAAYRRAVEMIPLGGSWLVLGTDPSSKVLEARARDLQALDLGDNPLHSLTAHVRSRARYTVVSGVDALAIIPVRRRDDFLASMVGLLVAGGGIYLSETHAALSTVSALRVVGRHVRNVRVIESRVRWYLWGSSPKS